MTNYVFPNISAQGERSAGESFFRTRIIITRSQKERKLCPLNGIQIINSVDSAPGVGLETIRLDKLFKIFLIARRPSGMSGNEPVIPNCQFGEIGTQPLFGD